MGEVERVGARSPYMQGYLAFVPGGQSRACPYRSGTANAMRWAFGFHDRFDDENDARTRRKYGGSNGRPGPAALA